MRLEEYIEESISSGNRKGEKYSRLTDGEITRRRTEQFLENNGYKYIGTMTGASLLRGFLEKKVYSLEITKPLKVMCFKVVVGKDIYYFNIPTDGRDPFVKMHSRPFLDVSIEDFENAVEGNAI